MLLSVSEPEGYPALSLEINDGKVGSGYKTYEILWPIIRMVIMVILIVIDSRNEKNIKLFSDRLWGSMKYPLKTYSHKSKCHYELCDVEKLVFAISVWSILLVMCLYHGRL